MIETIFRKPSSISLDKEILMVDIFIAEGKHGN